MKPGFQRVKTLWNWGFIAFRQASRTRIVILLVLAWRVGLLM